jgi:allantoate deiminase
LTAARLEAGFPEAGADLANLMGYLEIHIEQGPVLEEAGLALGVVPGIAGQTRILAGFTGQAGHAGTTPMPLRRDALAAAARLVLEAESHAQLHPPLLATVGKMEVLPGAGNVIPGQVIFTLDVRSPDNTAREAALEHLEQFGKAEAAARRLTWHWQVKQSNPAVPCDTGLSARLTEAVAAGQPVAPRIFSGAGHDAAVLAGVGPAAMLFVRCRAGLSHHPDEYASPEDLIAALEAVVRFVLSLAASPYV